MIILIAESKTMLSAESVISPEELAAHTPCFETTASEIMQGLGGVSLGQLASMLKLSGSLAGKMQKMVYEFGYKSTGNLAIEAFTGVVFKALDYPSLTVEARKRCDDRVRIISSLYGWLHPSDFIKPYRLDFTSHLDEGSSAGIALNTFWRMDVTKALVKEIQASEDSNILNLLPADAAKCIDWKLVKRFAKVWKADFQEMREGGMMKTPNAEKLKAMRGALLRQILIEDISDIEALKLAACNEYVCEGTPQYPDHLRFLC